MIPHLVPVLLVCHARWGHDLRQTGSCRSASCRIEMGDVQTTRPPRASHGVQ